MLSTLKNGEVGGAKDTNEPNQRKTGEQSARESSNRLGGTTLTGRGGENEKKDTSFEVNGLID